MKNIDNNDVKRSKKVADKLLESLVKLETQSSTEIGNVHSLTKHKFFKHAAKILKNQSVANHMVAEPEALKMEF